MDAQIALYTFVLHLLKTQLGRLLYHKILNYQGYEKRQVVSIFPER